MKRLLACFLLIVCTLFSCSRVEHYPLESLPASYSREDAIRDGCVLYEDGDVTYGKEIFEEFLGAVSEGEPASVRLGFYYTLDPTRVTAEYYKENKDRYPALYIKELTFDGEMYTIRHYEDGKEIKKEFRYMKYLPLYPKNIEADYERIDYYVLLNDDSVSSYDEIWRSLVSSRLGDYIEHSTVYSEYIRK